MTIKARNRAILAGAAITVAVVVVFLLPMLASGRFDKVREVRLVARDMTFYLEGSTEPNPTLTFRAGEDVRIILTNEDAGMDHDFSVSAWQTKTRVLEGRGSDAIVIKVPATKGMQTYICTPHSQKMRGTIRIE